MVRQAVGQNTPVLLGRKLTTKYFRRPNYIEVLSVQLSVALELCDQDLEARSGKPSL